jgi:hypothetical protein
VPAKGGALVPRILFVSEQERQLERLGQSDQLELGSSRERFRGVAAIESSAEAHERGALRGRERVFAPGVNPEEPPPPFLSPPESENEPSHARCAPAYRAALASDDDIDAFLVAAIVTQSRAESCESIRDRAAALDAHVIRVLPRDAHTDRSPPVRSPQSRPAGVAAATGPHLSVSSNRSSSQGADRRKLELPANHLQTHGIELALT